MRPLRWPSGASQEPQGGQVFSPSNGSAWALFRGNALGITFSLACALAACGADQGTLPQDTENPPGSDDPQSPPDLGGTMPDEAVENPEDVTFDVPEGGAEEPVLPTDTCEAQLHVIGVYEPFRNDVRVGSGFGGRVTVRIERPGKHVLYLASYESVKWFVSAAPGAQIEEIRVVGYEAQAVETDATEKTLIRTRLERSLGEIAFCGVEWPYEGGGCDTKELIRDAQEDTELGLTTFSGTYIGSRFILREDETVIDVDSDRGYDASELGSETSALIRKTCAGRLPL